jgi:two-component system, NarL family, sensor histidine kinase UhpB
VFRIVQECLTNIVRHAQATEAAIHLEIEPRKILRLEVSDNGRGCTLPETKKGFGLLGIRERVQSLEGELIIQSAQQQGMKITASIPLA